MALPENLNDLKEMDMIDLRQLHDTLTDKPVSMNARSPEKGIPQMVYERQIAWHVQQQAMGDMDAQTRSLFKAAINQAATAPKAKARSVLSDTPKRL